MATVTSNDGTKIAYSKSGQGEPLILVDGAICFRSFGPMGPLSEILSRDFTVYSYDRRGRGESGDTAPYAVEREVEDIAALIEEAGGSAYVYGISSGGALALEAAASGLPIKKLAIYESPYNDDVGARQASGAYGQQLRAAVQEGRRGDAIALFMGYVGTPAEAVAGMRQAPVWPVFESVAPTLAYDNAILGDGEVPTGRLAGIRIPTLVMYGEAGFGFMRTSAETITNAIPGAACRGLEGQTHEVAPDVIAPVLAEFFKG